MNSNVVGGFKQWRNRVLFYGRGGGGGWGVPRGGADLHLEGQEDGIAMIYCAQSKVKWGGGGRANEEGPKCEWWRGGGAWPP